MKELSIFIDESGDFGEYRYYSPYYIITMVFHDQIHDIRENIKKFNNELILSGFDQQHCIHTGPIIRRETPYENLNIQERRHLFNKMTSFTRQLNISFKCFHLHKNTLPMPQKLQKNFPNKLLPLFWKIIQNFSVMTILKFIMIMGRLNLHEFYLLY